MRITLWTLFAACTSDNVIEKQSNQSPSITIVSHGESIEVQEGYSEDFRATASDADHDFSELSVIWTIGDRIACAETIVSASGESYCELSFEPDDVALVAEVRDPGAPRRLLSLSSLGLRFSSTPGRQAQNSGMCVPCLRICGTSGRRTQRLLECSATHG